MAVPFSIATLERTIFDLLPKGLPTIDHAARQCGMSVRTLQRRLHAAGLTYSELLDKTRMDAACRLLGDLDQPICKIASATGFTNPSNFTRAFQRWAGMAPRSYRQNITKGRL